MPRERAGMLSSASEAPMPHSPPIAMPKAKRSTSNTVSVGAKAQASSSNENSSTSNISTGRRP